MGSHDIGEQPVLQRLARLGVGLRDAVGHLGAELPDLLEIEQQRGLDVLVGADLQLQRDLADVQLLLLRLAQARRAYHLRLAERLRERHVARHRGDLRSIRPAGAT